MAMDPQFGEISRAMRNRGIEIYLLPPASYIVKLSNSYVKAYELTAFNVILDFYKL